MIKRTFDVIISAAFLILVFPFIFILVAPAVKLSSPGPVFFRQKRTGRHGRVFSCYKFRTMYVNTDCDLIQASASDKRITPVGGKLRQTFIDEFPQFFNVLRGDMSIVGPRPHMLRHTEMFSEIVPDYHRRHDVRPGITGLAQANGWIGETKTSEEIIGRVKYDLEYVDKSSFLLDIRIIGKTIGIFFKGLLKRLKS